MPDITLCRNKRCQLDCYRRFAKPDTHQSYSKFTSKKGKCEYFMGGGFMPKKIISMTKYKAIIDKIGRKKQPVSATLIEMLEEAGKYEIKKDSSK